MNGAFSARYAAHRVPSIPFTVARVLSRVLCAAPFASRIASFAPRFLPRAARIAFAASCSPQPVPPSNPTETDTKPLIRLR